MCCGPSSRVTVFSFPLAISGIEGKSALSQWILLVFQGSKGSAESCPFCKEETGPERPRPAPGAGKSGWSGAVLGGLPSLSPQTGRKGLSGPRKGIADALRDPSSLWPASGLDHRPETHLPLPGQIMLPRSERSYEVSEAGPAQASCPPNPPSQLPLMERTSEKVN